MNVRIVLISVEHCWNYDFNWFVGQKLTDITDHVRNFEAGGKVLIYT